MSPKERKTLGKQARDFVINNYSIEVVGKFFEDLFDELPLIDWEKIDLSGANEEKRNPDYRPDKNMDNSEWLLDVYKNILKMDVDTTDNGYKYWMNEFIKGKERQAILDFFCHTARKENSELFKKSLKEIV